MAATPDADALAAALGRVLGPGLRVEELRRVSGGASRETWLFDAYGPGDVRYGLVKSASFGLAITLIGARRGLRAEGGAVGVGSAATSAVVYSAVLILVLDAFWAVTWLLGHEATYQ